MKITAWRIIKAQHAGRAFEGEGARLVGGRWNKIGTPVIYTADSLALAALEILVHLPKVELLKSKYQRIPVQFDSRLVKSLNPIDLPADWDILPPPESTRIIGTEWALKKQSVLFKVPSTIIREEFNYLINPLHPDIKKLSIGNPQKFVFDPRIKI
ncbi:MAG: RES domain-containing protein [Desulfobacterales bacterium]|jgi:RES domain-containing protein